MEKDINFIPLYSVGKIVKSKEGKIILCAFCEKEIKVSEKEIVVKENNRGFYHVNCYKDFQNFDEDFKKFYEELVINY